MILGTLGNLTWFRCRDCGAEFNVPTADLVADHETTCPVCGEGNDWDDEEEDD